MSGAAAAIALFQSERAARIKAKAIELGFDLVGITAVGPSMHADFLRQWLADGRAGEMTYLQRRFDERTDPAVYFPGARSAVCVAINYCVDPLPTDAPVVPARIARYARGDDYHVFLKNLLYDLADWLRNEWPDADTRCGTDTVPVLERELAARAGIGWVGKNTCVIHPEIGSWVLLGEVLTTIPLAVDEPITDHCGTCTRCLDACPTQALEPFKIDPRKCISYLTIESRGHVPAELSAKMGDWLFGCDICQDVCPWNQRVDTSDNPAVAPRLPAALDATIVAEWTGEQYTEALRHTPMKRVKLPQWQANARRVIENATAMKLHVAEQARPRTESAFSSKTYGNVGCNPRSGSGRRNPD